MCARGPLARTLDPKSGLELPVQTHGSSGTPRPSTSGPSSVALSVVNSAQDTIHESKLSPQFSTTTAGGGSKFSTTTHETKMPPDGYVAEKPGAGGAPPDGANLERMANKDLSLIHI